MNDKWKDMDALVDASIHHYYEQLNQLIDQVPPYVLNKVRKDTVYTLSYLKVAVTNQTPSIFSNYMIWLRELLEHLKLSFDDETYFNSIRYVLEKTFQNDTYLLTIFDHGMIAYHHAKQENIRSVSLNEQNQIILNDLLSYNRNDATKRIIDLHQNGMEIKAIYQEVFTPILHKVGELWHQNKINVATEHYVTAVIQSIMPRLYPEIFSIQKGDKKLLSLAAGKELHEVGIRMISDLFELEGWDTVYLGSNLPLKSVMEELIKSHYDVLCISTTLPINIDYTKELIKLIRSKKEFDHLKIIVGGYVYLQNTNLWKQIGADYFAKDFEHALTQLGGIE